MHRVGDTVQGMCFLNGRLYTLEGIAEEQEDEDDYPVYRYRLAVYTGINEDNLILLDTLELEDQFAEPVHPRGDHHTRQVYIPGTYDVCVFRLDGSSLIRVRSLRCVKCPRYMAVFSADALYVCDHDSTTICLVDVNQDRVTSRLHAPPELNGLYNAPNHIAVLGDTILVSYSYDRMVIYRHGIPTPGKLIYQIPGLQSMNSLSTDNHLSFLVTHPESSTVSVLDLSGKLIHTIVIPSYIPRDCTVVGAQLWVGCASGHIIVMSPQFQP